MQPDQLTRYVRNPQYLCRTIAGETIIVPVGAGVADLASVFVMSPVGSVIWSCIGQAADVNAIVEQLTSEYDVSAEQAEHDVHHFLNQIEEAGLIVDRTEDLPNDTQEAGLSVDQAQGVGR
jgi:hypothetical protein